MMYRYRIESQNVRTYTPWQPAEWLAFRDLDRACGPLQPCQMGYAVHIMGAYETLTATVEQGRPGLRQAGA